MREDCSDHLPMRESRALRANDRGLADMCGVKNAFCSGPVAGRTAETTIAVRSRGGWSPDGDSGVVAALHSSAVECSVPVTGCLVGWCRGMTVGRESVRNVAKQPPVFQFKVVDTGKDKIGLVHRSSDLIPRNDCSSK